MFATGRVGECSTHSAAHYPSCDLQSPDHVLVLVFERTPSVLEHIAGIGFLDLTTMRAPFCPSTLRASLLRPVVF